MLTYRREIDGLRAIAVLMVFFHHLGIHAFSGGYTGVDIFFVISGFVIFRSIINDIHGDGFSVRLFYERRIRRILPPLIVVIVICLLAGLLISTPAEYTAMAKSAIAALFSVSNIYFDDEAGNYFSAAAGTLPLLHTWSLGVEEQFYLLVPLLFLAKNQRKLIKRLVRVLLVVIVLTFCFNLFEVYYRGKLNHAFYLPTARFWEIAIGGLLALAERYQQNRFKSAKRQILAYLGVSGIIASILLLDDSTLFPGLWALLPVLSTALLIQSSPQEGGLVYRVLTHKLMVFLGKISYSLYLFHWPLIVFTGLYLGRGLKSYEMLVILLVTIVLSFLSWRFVEQPFRQRRSKIKWSMAKRYLVLASLVVLSVALWGIFTKGFSSRINKEYLIAAENREAKPCERILMTGLLRKADICSRDNIKEKIDYMLWGDSHAGMYGAELVNQLQKMKLSGAAFTMPDCQPLFGVYTNKSKNRAECAALAKYIIQKLEQKKVSTVILAARWANLGSLLKSPGDGVPSKRLYDSWNHGESISLENALYRTVKKIRSFGAKVLIIGPTPEIEFNVPNMFIRTKHLGLQMPIVQASKFRERQSLVLTALKKVQTIEDVRVVYPHKSLCDNKQCQVVEGSHVLYTDDDHLSRSGVNKVMPALLSNARELFGRSRADIKPTAN